MCKDKEPFGHPLAASDTKLVNRVTTEAKSSLHTITLTKAKAWVRNRAGSGCNRVTNMHPQATIDHATGWISSRPDR